MKLYVKIYFNPEGDDPISVVKKMKDLGFSMATKAGLSFSTEDLRAYPKKEELLAKTEREVERIEATGDVKIAYGTKRAHCEKAVYYVKEEKVVLEGHPMLWEGDNRLKGGRIVVFLKEDRAIAEGIGQEQVELTIVEKGGEGKLLPRP